MNVKGLYRRGMSNSYRINLEELLNDTKALPFSYLISEDKERYFEDFINESQARNWKIKKCEKSKDIIPINEATRKELLDGADKARKDRAKKLTTRYKGVTHARGWITFETSSQYTPGKKYTQYIKLNEARDMKYFKEFKKSDIIRLFLTGDLSVYCNCLLGSTKIKLLSGEVDTIENLVNRYESGEELWVYSTDSNGDFKPGRVSRVWKTKEVRKYLRITLDNGEVIECTENHPFMLRDGSYLRADKLEIGTSLMPLYFRDIDGYENVRFNTSMRYKSVYKEVSKECHTDGDIKEALDRSGEACYAIHHKDYNKKNNHPKNLKLMGVKEHIKFHADFVRDRWENDEEFREKNRSAVSKKMTELNQHPTEAMISNRKSFIEKGHEYWRTEEGRKRKSNEMSVNIRKYWENISDEERERKISNCALLDKDVNRKAVEGRKRYIENLSESEYELWKKKNVENLSRGGKVWRDSLDEKAKEEWKIRTALGKCNKVVEYLISNDLEVTEENYYKYKKRTDPIISKWFNSFNDMLKMLDIATSINHKVANIETVEVNENVSVYDMSVDKYHNFYVDAGVILHNCPDFKYRGFKYMGTQMGYSIFKENRFPKIRNPKLEGTVCKHLICVLSVLNNNWMSIAKDMKNSKFFKKNYEDEDYINDIKKKGKK